MIFNKTDNREKKSYVGKDAKAAWEEEKLKIFFYATIGLGLFIPGVISLFAVCFSFAFFKLVKNTSFPGLT